MTVCVPSAQDMVWMIRILALRPSILNLPNFLVTETHCSHLNQGVFQELTTGRLRSAYPALWYIIIRLRNNAWEKGESSAVLSKQIKYAHDTVNS